MKVIEVWDIQQWDGCDRHNHAFYLSDSVEKERYLFLHKHDIALQKTLVIFDTLEEVQENDVKELRKKALAKLTPLERKALGLSSS